MGRVVLKRVKRRANTAHATRAAASSPARTVRYIDSEKFNQFNPSVLGLGDIALPSRETEAIAAVMECQSQADHTGPFRTTGPSATVSGQAQESAEPRGPANQQTYGAGMMRYSLAGLCLAMCVLVALLAAACDTGFTFGIAAGGDQQPAGVQDGAGDAQQDQEGNGEGEGQQDADDEEVEQQDENGEDFDGNGADSRLGSLQGCTTRGVDGGLYALAHHAERRIQHMPVRIEPHRGGEIEGTVPAVAVEEEPVVDIAVAGGRYGHRVGRLMDRVIILAIQHSRSLIGSGTRRSRTVGAFTCPEFSSKPIVVDHEPLHRASPQDGRPRAGSHGWWGELKSPGGAPHSPGSMRRPRRPPRSPCR